MDTTYKHGDKGWIAVDLDSTLALYDTWRGEDHIGAPIPAMVAVVKQQIAAGEDVRIFTARACNPNPGVIKAIQDWCLEHLGKVLLVTNHKDYQIREIWDDRAVQIVPNKGMLATDAAKLEIIQEILDAMDDENYEADVDELYMRTVDKLMLLRHQIKEKYRVSK